jgi:hypothetical protein
MLDPRVVREVGGSRHQRVAHPAASLTGRDHDVRDLDEATVGQSVRLHGPEHRHAGRLAASAGENDAAVGTGDRLEEALADVGQSHRVDRALGPTADLAKLVPEPDEHVNVGGRGSPRQDRGSGQRKLLGWPQQDRGDPGWGAATAVDDAP